MASALEVFDATVFEAVFDTMSVKDGDAACDIVSVGLAELVDGLDPADALQFISPNAPRIVPENAENDDGSAMIVNDFWYRRETFAPIFFAIARAYYERVHPASYPPPPKADIRENDTAMFGCELADIWFPEGHSDQREAALVLWAGAVAAAVKFCFQRSVAMPLGYALLFANVRDGVLQDTVLS
ncbi:hypothetical protein [uncultured Tateyamaria sp.]|nr:hypothetical protein [uncultured Tateyamaria sp.]